MKKIFYVLCFIALSHLGYSQDEADPFQFGASYVGENQNNLSGGLKTGSGYLGMANITLGLNTEAVGLWKGGQLFVNGANTHGQTPSSELFGDYQVASNIEAGNHTFLQELWYKQTIGNVSLTFGLQDLNTEFVSSEFAGLFLNSSFGTHSTLSTNMPVPIFPLTTVGAIFKWAVNNKVTLSTALFDGCPTDFEQNAYNTRWKLNSEDGVLSVSELQFNALLLNDLSGSYRLGFYYHNHLINENNGGLDTVFVKNYGFYVSADQWLWQNNALETGIGVFAQLGVSPEKYNTNQFYLGMGINYKGILRSRVSDVAGVAVAHARFHNAVNSHETSFELNYKAQLNNRIFIQPSFQYIVNPSGTDTKLNNVFAGAIRFGFEF